MARLRRSILQPWPLETRPFLVAREKMHSRCGQNSRFPVHSNVSADKRMTASTLLKSNQPKENARDTDLGS